MKIIEKIESAKKLIEETLETYQRVAVACSFGKDSMVVLHLAREVEPRIKVFSVMTQYKPRETLEYVRAMNSAWNLGTTVYMVADSVPETLQDDSLEVVLLPTEEFCEKASRIKAQTGEEIYAVDPDECCRLLKVNPTIEAVRELDAWITGLRRTEGRTRVDYQEVEKKGGLTKVNPILNFTEAEIWRYIATRGIQPHPWYGKGYRSLGCAPCSNLGGELERDGRWQNTYKCGGECGIHTQWLR
ncbi:MAG: phosphoadenosine phosphosulfate reductase family protein [Candidatus Thorarchaeota archaeon]